MSLALVPFSQPEEMLPSAAWTSDQLASYVREKLAYASLLGRKTGQQLWLAGAALRIVQAIHKARGTWTAWMQKAGVTPSVAYEAIKINKTFEDINDIAGLDVAEMKWIAGVTRKKKPKPQVPFVQPNPVPPTIQPQDGDVIQDKPCDYTHPTQDFEPTYEIQSIEHARIDPAPQLANVLGVVLSLTDALDRIDPASIPTDVINSILVELGRLNAHATAQ